jgi:hypothetical protein
MAATYSRKPGPGRPKGLPNGRTTALGATLDAAHAKVTRALLDEVIPDRQLAQLLWKQALQGDGRVATKRALHDTDPNPALNLWRLIYGILLDTAVLEWCKVFGADSEPTHWKKVVADPDAFRARLLEVLGRDPDSWREYRDHLKQYRDNFIAHQDNQTAVATFPDLTLALEASYYYYEYLIAEWRRMGEERFPDDLREYARRYVEQARSNVRLALEATRGIREHVF